MLTGIQYTPQQEQIAKEILAEYDRACKKFAPFHSFEEGVMVLREEIDELWDEVKRQQGERNKENMRKEAIQVGAMAWRLYKDCLELYKDGSELKACAYNAKHIMHEQTFNSAHEGIGYIESSYHLLFLEHQLACLWKYAFNIVEYAIDFVLSCCDATPSDERHLERHE